MKNPVKTESKPVAESTEVQALITGICCAECRRALTAAFSSLGKLLLQHDKSNCSQSLKHFEPPTVNLKEAK